MKKTTLIAIFAIILMLPMAAYAYEVNNGDSVYISKDRTVEGNLYAAGSSITIDGKVTGDVICAGQSININGTVEGDVICAEQSLTINGQVKGNIRSAGSSAAINGPVGKNVMFFGADYTLGDKGEIGWENMLGVATARIKGKIGRTLHGAAANAIISGKVGGDVKLRMDDRNASQSVLKIEDKSEIGGSLVYTSAKEADISGKAKIKGERKHNAPQTEEKKGSRAMDWVWGLFFSLFSALLVGVILISMWPSIVKDMTIKMQNQPGASFGWGMVVLLLTPILSIILLVTIIGIPLSFIMVGSYLIAIYMSTILTGIMLGQVIVNKYWAAKKDSLGWAMALGVVVLYLVSSIPFVGMIISLAALLWGLGGIFLQIKSRNS